MIGVLGFALAVCLWIAPAILATVLGMHLTYRRYVRLLPALILAIAAFAILLWLKAVELSAIPSEQDYAGAGEGMMASLLGMCALSLAGGSILQSFSYVERWPGGLRAAAVLITATVAFGTVVAFLVWAPARIKP